MNMVFSSLDDGIKKDDKPSSSLAEEDVVATKANEVITEFCHYLKD